MNSPLTTAVPLNSGAFICGCSIAMVGVWIETLKLTFSVSMKYFSFSWEDSRYLENWWHFGLLLGLRWTKLYCLCGRCVTLGNLWPQPRGNKCTDKTEFTFDYQPLRTKPVMDNFEQCSSLAFFSRQCPPPPWSPQETLTLTLQNNKRVTNLKQVSLLENWTQLNSDGGVCGQLLSALNTLGVLRLVSIQQLHTNLEASPFLKK